MSAGDGIVSKMPREAVTGWRINGYFPDVVSWVKAQLGL